MLTKSLGEEKILNMQSLIAFKIKYKLQLMIAWELNPKSVIAWIKYKFNDSLRSQLKTI